MKETSGRLLFSCARVYSWSIFDRPARADASALRLRFTTALLVLGMWFLRSPQGARAQIATDVRVSTNQNAASATVSTPAFSTKAAGELLLALVAMDELTPPNTTVKSISGGGLTWTLVVRTNSQPGGSEIWRAWAPATLSKVAVTATLSQGVASSITVMSFTGASPAGANGSGAIGAHNSSSSSKGAPSASLITTGNNSVVVGVGNDYENAIARTPVAGQALVNQALSATGDTYWVQQFSTSVAAAGTKVTLGDTSPSADDYNLSICEILATPPAQAQAQATLTATSLNFGGVVDGSAATLPVTIESTGTLSLKVSSASITGAPFSIVAASFPQTVLPGHSLTLQLKFAPGSTGAASGNLAISTNSTGGAVRNVSLAGSGVAAAPKLALSASSLAFGSVVDNTSKSQTVSLTSTGNSPVTVHSDAITGTGYSIVSGTLPATLAPQQSLSLGVQFLPKTAGSAAGTLTISSNSTTGATASVALSGTGVAPSAHSVTIGWVAPLSSPQPVTGYYVYRSTGGDSFSRLTSSPDAKTSYIDTTVTAGTMYSYLVTSVDSAGVESIASNPVTVTVPSS